MKSIFLICTALFFSSPSNKEAEKLLSKHLQKQYCYIPSGELHLSDKQKIEVEGFYMMNTEVTALAYREFLSSLNQSELKDVAQLSDAGWHGSLTNEEYLYHPRFQEYPITNITQEAAQMYCAFLKNALNRSGNIEEGYEVANVRLPTKNEWMYAARGGRQLTPYPWGGYYVRNAKGCYLAHFNKIGTESIRKNYETGQLEVIDRGFQKNEDNFTKPARSFFPNDFGLYQMSGNVAEMVAEGVAMGGSFNSTGYDIQITSEMPFKNSSIEVGFRPIFSIVKK